MSAKEPAQSGFAFGASDYDWSRYERVRPKYGPTLCNQILAYHRAHDGRFDLAHDVGSGLGHVADKYLIPNFKHVVVSDPTATNVDVIRARLGNYEDEGRITIKQAAGETRFLLDNSVDLVTAFECLHWSDRDKSMPNMAAQLKPGGTFAVLYYTPQPFFLDSEAAQNACSRLVDTWSKQSARKDNPLLRYSAQSFHGADGHIKLSTDYFLPGAKRISINTSLLKNSAYTHPETPFQIGKYHDGEGAPNVVGPDDQLESIVDVETWSEKIDWYWLDELIHTLVPPVEEDNLQEEFKELKQAFSDAGGQLTIVWILELVLATKK